MKKQALIIFVLVMINIINSYSQDSPVAKSLQGINRNVLQAQLEFLASDWMEGRKAGEKGEAISSDYIASMLKLYGVKPWGDPVRNRNVAEVNAGRSYFQNFILIKSVQGPEQEMKIKSNEQGITRITDLANNIDFTTRAVSQAEIEAPVVFAGYGFKNDKLKFNDFNKLDLKGKFILRISGVPQFAKKSMSQDEIFNAQRDLVNFAMKAGAAGIIEFNPSRNTVGSPSGNDFENMSPAEGTPRASQVYASYAIPGKESPDEFIRASISASAAEKLLHGSGNSVDEYIRKADANEQYTFSSLNGKTVYIKTSVLRTAIQVRNVLGIIEGNKQDEFIVVGAHYDHMGMNAGYLWNGADDNGSGTVGVMTIARAITETGIKPDKSIIFALWTAEEEGLLGSRYYVQNLGPSVKNIKLNLNFDMISRYIADDKPNNVVMTYTNTKESFREMTISNVEKYGIGLDIDYQPSADPPGGSDHRTFTAAGVPVMRFKPGHREEYHTPADETGTIDWDIMEKIVKISFANIWQLANSEW